MPQVWRVGTSSLHSRMEKPERSKFTAAGEIANERLVEAVLDPDRYPEGTTFIAADQKGFDSISSSTYPPNSAAQGGSQGRKAPDPAGG